MALSGGSGGGGSGSAGSIRAGRAHVELSANDSKLRAGLSRAKAMVERFADGLKSVGLKSLGAGAALGLPLVGGIKAALDEGTKLKNLSATYGDSVEQLSAMQKLFQQSGVDAETFLSSLENWPERLSEAADGAGPLVDLFRRIGLDARKMIELPLVEQFAQIADATARVRLPTDQARIMSELFSDMGLKLTPLLKLGGANLLSGVAGVRASGAVMTTEQATKAADANKRLAEINSQLSASFREVGLALLPSSDAIKAYGEAAAAAIKAGREWLGNHKELVVAVAATSAGLIAFGAAAAVIGPALKALSSVLTILAGSVKLFSQVLTVALSNPKLLLALTAVAGIAYVFRSEIGSFFADMAGDIFGKIKDFGSGVMARVERFRPGAGPGGGPGGGDAAGQGWEPPGGWAAYGDRQRAGLAGQLAGLPQAVRGAFDVLSGARAIGQFAGNSVAERQLTVQKKIEANTQEAAELLKRFGFFT